MRMSQPLPFPAALAPLAARLRLLPSVRDWRPERRHIYWALMASSIVCLVTYTLFGAYLGSGRVLLAIGCSAGCGWSWLLARSLFQPAGREPVWPLAIVVTQYVTGALLILAGDATDTQPALRMAGNIQTLTSSTVLMLGWLEALNGYGPHLSKPERRFRLIFASFYGAMVALAVLWGRQSPEGSLAAQLDEVIDLTCASLALTLSWLAVRFRDTHPLPLASKTQQAKTERKNRPLADGEAHQLAQAIERALVEDEAFTTPDLKVADLSRLIGAADYKVTQAITGPLGFRNFNHMVNHFRIERAKAMLADPQFDDRSILAVAMECGFGSIGPFNRAFKAATDTTPRAYRTERGSAPAEAVGA